MKGKITGLIPGHIIQLYVTNTITELFDSASNGARGKSNARIMTKNGFEYEVDLSDFVLIYNTSAVFASASASHANQSTGGSDTMTNVPEHTHTFKDYYGMPNGAENGFSRIYLYDGKSATSGGLKSYDAGYQAINVTETSRTGAMYRYQTDQSGVQHMNYVTHTTESTSNGSNAADNRQYTEYVITMSYEPLIWTL